MRPNRFRVAFPPASLTGIFRLGVLLDFRHANLPPIRANSHTRRAMQGVRRYRRETYATARFSGAL
jgi:hypothetical protein